MMTLAWDLHGFEELLLQCVKFTEVVQQLKARLSLSSSRQGNIKAKVSYLRNQLLDCEEPIWKEKNSCHPSK